MNFLSKWLGPKGWPIGVDLGGETLKLAQIASKKGGARELVAAASASVPDGARRDPVARIAFFQEHVRQLLSRGRFRGRQVVLSLPASCMYIERVRVPKMDDSQIKQAVLWESRGKLPIDPSNALLRHVVAGEVYEAQDPVNEVIVMAADRELMNRFLKAATRAKLDVVGMTAEPQATVDCFAHALAGTQEAGLTRMYVDIGISGTRVYIARGPQMLFARAIPVGGGHLNQAVASAMKMPLEQACQLRRQRHQSGGNAASGDSPAEGGGQAGYFPLARRASAHEASGGGATAVAAPPPQPKSSRVNPVDAACAPLIRRLIEELDGCLRYHESTFPACPVEQVLFIGGEANKQGLCQHLAVALGLPAGTGDPLARMTAARGTKAIDISRPQPAWTVAAGLSLGTVV